MTDTERKLLERGLRFFQDMTKQQKEAFLRKLGMLDEDGTISAPHARPPKR